MSGYHGTGEFDLHYDPACPACISNRDKTRPDVQWEEVYAQVDAAHAAPVPPGLDAAVTAGWTSFRLWAPFDASEPWEAEASKQISFGRGGATRYRRVRAIGPTPADALNALAARLEGEK